jgi:hypothetical protein
MSLDGIAIGDLTAPGLLGIAILMLLFGKLVPRATLMDKTREAENWRNAYEKEREAKAISDAQTAELLEVTKTTYNVVVALFGTTERMRHADESGGTPHAVPSTTK